MHGVEVMILTRTAILLCMLAPLLSWNTEARSFRQVDPIKRAPAIAEQSPVKLPLNSLGGSVASDNLDMLLRTAQGSNISLALAESLRDIDRLSLSSIPNLNSQKLLLQARPRPRRARVESALREVLLAWNSGNLTYYLAPDFFDGQRLNQNLRQFIPQDARLELLQLEGFQILSDQLAASASQTIARSWLVSVDALTQIEYTDPVAGFVQLRGRQRYTLRLFDYARQINE